MTKYRKKPVVIEAFKLGTDEAPKGFNEQIIYFREPETNELICAEIKTLEGLMTANIGDYIIKGIKGEIYPCKSNIFEATYDKVED